MHRSSHLLLILLLLAGGFVVPGQALAFGKVVIDAGHGGHDRGASAGLTYEKHLALDVSRRLAAYLKKHGIRSSLTRERDQFVSLPRRVRMANTSGNEIFVSIHFNSASASSATGIETYYSSKNRKSYALAHMVQSASIYKTKTRNRGVKHGNFHVLSQNNRPAILVECAFLSNPSDRYRALSPTYRQNIAEAIAMGIIKYKETR